MSRLRLLTLEGTSPTSDGTGIDLSVILPRLAQLPKVERLWLRIPMFFGIEPKVYLPICQGLKAAGYGVMIEPIDSEDLGRYSVAAVSDRVLDSSVQLAGHYDAIECANEINGDRGNTEWTGPLAYAKAKTALAATGNHVPAVATYYLSGDDPEWMWQWIRRHPLPVDYALVSYYPHTSPESRLVDPRDIFPRLAKETGAKAVGLGEYGTENAAGENPADSEERSAMIRLFEARPLTCPEDVGGGGYWDAYDNLSEPDILSAFHNSWVIESGKA